MVRRSCFVEMVILGIVCYAVVAVLQLVKISKIPKTDALKNVEIKPEICFFDNTKNNLIIY